uniref:leucine-rich repeat and WD repeat-containing protein 1-like n=1 Tax=Myxine glutinosa TaxID=7769 RepID=UPI00358E1C54
MCFHPSQESLLFTAAYDKTVTLWDIGIPDTELNFSHLKLMTLAVAGVPLKLTSVMACPERGLLAAGVGGCWAWDISLEDSKTYRHHHVKFSFPVVKNTKNADWRTVDALVFVSDDVIASRSVGQGSLYLWSWAQSVQVEGWPARISRPCRAVILAVLPWMITQELYTGLASVPGHHYLVSGAVGGSLYVYNLRDMIDGNENAGKCNPQIVQWPGKGNECEEEEENDERKEKENLLINSLAMDPRLRFVVALTNKNSVCIWRGTPQA